MAIKKKIVHKKQTPKSEGVGYKNPPKHTQFKKGNNANPIGSNAHNQELKALKKITHETVKEIIDVALNGTLADLKAIAEDPTSSALQVGLATSLANAIKKGDFGVLSAIITKLTGEMPKKVDITTNGKDINSQNVTKVLLQLPANGRTREETENKGKK